MMLGFRQEDKVSKTQRLDIIVNRNMKKLSNYWHTKEKHNYLDVLQPMAYKMFMKYYVGENPYNMIVEEKYKERLKELEI